MFATAGFTRLAVTQLMPLMTPDVDPDPLQLRTRTPRIRTAFATPHFVPPIVPATWVPWPLQSLPLRPSPTVSAAIDARPPKSACARRMPVSITYTFTPAPVVVYL